MSKEIVRAGVRYNNKVYDGFNHGECFKKLPTEANMINVEQGFITNEGEFVDRKKAFTIARKANQLEYDYGIQKVLISEDVHINWLHKKDKTIADLEAKLAEYKLYIESFKHSQDLDKKYISKLESDLAEKCRLLKTNETLLSGTKIIEKEINQDKISFALEQLEKVKKELEFNSNNNEWITARDDRILNGICNFIDNQINVLRNNKDGIH